MCFPGATALASVGLSAATSIAAGNAQNQANTQSYEAAVEKYQLNEQDALAVNRADETSLTLRQMQENQSTAQQEQMAAVEGAQKQAQVRVSAAQGGVAGNDVTNIINGIGEQVNQKQTTLAINWQNTAQQLQSQKTADVAEEQMRINSQPIPTYQGTEATDLTTAGNLLKIAGSPSGQSAIGTVQNGFSNAASGLNISGM
jgi:hypothetical protein